MLLSFVLTGFQTSIIPMRGAKSEAFFLILNSKALRTVSLSPTPVIHACLSGSLMFSSMVKQIKISTTELL